MGVGTISELVALGFIIKEDEQTIGSKPASSTHSWLLKQLLPPASGLVGVPVLTYFEDEQ